MSLYDILSELCYVGMFLFLNIYMTEWRCVLVALCLNGDVSE